MRTGITLNTKVDIMTGCSKIAPFCVPVSAQDSNDLKQLSIYNQAQQYQD